MRPVRNFPWLGLVIWVSFSILTMLTGWQNPASKNRCTFSRKGDQVVVCILQVQIKVHYTVTIDQKLEDAKKINTAKSSSNTHTRLTALFPGLPRWAGTRKVKPIWILLNQETVSGSGISWAICKSAPRSRQITMPAPHHSVFYRLDAFPAAQPTASKHWRHKCPPVSEIEMVNKRSANIPAEASSVLTTALLTGTLRCRWLKKYDQMQSVSMTPTRQGYVPTHTTGQQMFACWNNHSNYWCYNKCC